MKRDTFDTSLQLINSLLPTICHSMTQAEAWILLIERAKRSSLHCMNMTYKCFHTISLGITGGFDLVRHPVL
jgi:hypothetical protein